MYCIEYFFRIKRKIVLLLLLTGVIHHPKTSMSSKLQTVSIQNVTSIKMKLVTELMKLNVGDTLVLVQNGDDLEAKKKLISQNIFVEIEQTLSVIIMQSEFLTFDMIDELKALNLKSNRRSFYIFLFPLDEDGRQKVMRLVRMTNAWDWESKIAIIYPSNTGVSQYYGKLGIYNLYIFVPDIFDESYRIYDICRFCENGEDSVQFINVWRSKLGFKYQTKFQKSFRGEWYGKDFIIASHLQFPYFYPKALKDDGNYIFDGTVYNRYVVMAQVLNMTLHFVSDEDDLSTEEDSVDPINYIYALIFGEIDIMGGGWECNDKIYDYVPGGISASFGEAGEYSIISIAPLKGILPWNGFISPFSKKVWALLLTSIPVCSIVLYMLRKFTDQKVSIWNSFWDIVVIVCWDNIRYNKPSLGCAIHLSSFMVSCYLIISLYLGYFSANIIIPKYTTPPIDNINLLLENNMYWVTATIDSTATFHWLQYFSYISDMEERHVEATPVNSFEPFEVTALRKVAQNPDDMVTFLTKRDADNFIKDFRLAPKDRKFYYSKQVFGAKSHCDYFNQDFYGKEVWNKKIVELRDFGFDEYFLRPYTRRSEIKDGLKKAQHQEELSMEDELGLIRMEHFKICVLVLLFVFGVGVTIFIIEILVDHFVIL